MMRIHPVGFIGVWLGLGDNGQCAFCVCSSQIRVSGEGEQGGRKCSPLDFNVL